MKTQADGVANQTSRLNVTSDYDATNDYIDKFLNQTAFLNYTQGTNISFVQAQINTINQQVADLNNFNFSYAYYYQSLDAVNNITTDLPRNDGTVIHNYYTQYNITTLACQQYPYDNIDKTTQENLCVRANVSITLTNQLNQTLSEINQIKSTAEDISAKLQGFVGTYEQVAVVQNEILSTMDSVRAGAGESYNNTLWITATALKIVGLIEGIIQNGTNSFLVGTECAYVGQAYTDLTSDLCSGMRPALQVTAAMMLVGACTMFFGAIVSWVSAKKLRDLGSYTAGV